MHVFPVMTYAGNAIFANLDRWVPCIRENCSV
jgi:hypothetical protein